MTLKAAVVLFPGSNCEQDAVHALEYLGVEAAYVWHHSTHLTGADMVILPGGFSYGDYLRTGAIAAFSPIMQAVRSFAADGGLVLGICNGFQILCESGLLPGALRRNAGLKFRCMPVHVRVETTGSPFTSEAVESQVLQIPINHFEGNYYCSPETYLALESEFRIPLRYCTPAGDISDAGNPNGSFGNVAAVLSESRNVMGMMPHPEKAIDPDVGGTDGKVILGSMIRAVQTLRTAV